VAFFLGIDGGGSKTSCLVGNDTAELGSATAGASNVVRVGEDRARESLHTVIMQACQAASVKPSEIKRACIGAAGAARAEVREVMSGLVAEIIAGSIEVVGDMEIALEAAFEDGPGVIVISGTGSIAYGRDATGQTARAGGWGFAISDEGSGHWIGRTAVASAVHGGDQATDTCLLKAIAKFWGVITHQQVVLKANETPTPNFAALLPVVLKAAEKNNRQARAVLTQAAEELAMLAKRVISQLFSGAASVPLAMSGGVFANSPLVREVFYNSLQAGCSSLQLNPSVIEPVHGALQRARRIAR
jgi:glucosamine kinase